MATLGSAIRSLRTRVGLSQLELARLVGVSRGRISRIERDRSQAIRPQLLVRLASILGVTASELLPGAPPRRAVSIGEGSRADVFRVGFWESVWTAPVIPLSEEPPPSIALSSRVRVGSIYTVITPVGQHDPRSRPLTPGELVRALRSAYYAAILVPRQIMLEYPDELTECAQVALAVDGVRAAVCINREDAVADGFDGTVTMAESSPVSSAAWERVRAASLISPVKVYFPSGVGVADTVDRLRDALDRRVEVRAIAPEKWPRFWNSTNDAVPPGGRPVIAVAAEPYLDAWRRSVWESNLGLTTVAVGCREIWRDSPPTVSLLSLLFHRERCAGWLTKPVVYEFLDAVERQAQEIVRHSPRALGAIAERLQLGVPTILRECASCDFTTRFAPSWVAQLRAASAERLG